MARNLGSHVRSAKEWHLTPTGYLRSIGVKTASFRADSWEIDWTKRNGKLVWARNPCSKMPSAKDWHWIDFHTVENAGLSWKPKREKTGRHVSNGYVFLSMCGMTDEEIALADAHKLWSRSKRKSGRGFVPEHRLNAVKKFGRIPPGHVVRHMNGVKADNHPDNLLLGTTAENNMDHDTARRMTMYWRAKFEETVRREAI